MLLLTLCIALILKSHTVQTWLGKKAAAWLSEELGAEVTVERLAINLFSDITLEEILVKGQAGDTLLALSALQTGRFSYDRHVGHLFLNDVKLVSPIFHLYIKEGEDKTNLTFIQDYFKSTDTTKTGGAFTMNVGKARIENARFTYHNNNKPLPGALVNFNHIKLDSLFIEADDFVLGPDSVTFDLKNLAFKERCGFVLNNLSGKAVIGDSLIALREMNLQTPKTKLKGDTRFDFESFRDFNRFSSSVVMDHRLIDSQLYFGDLRFFSKEFEGLDRTVMVTGDFKGKLNRLRGRNMLLQWDANSYLIGNVRTEGLPKINQTFWTVDITELNTNKEEIDRIPLPPFTDGRTIKTPENISALGNISIKGNFTGFFSDFVAFADIRTALGSIKTDMQLSEDSSNNLHYRGGLRLQNFNLGSLANESTLGSVTANLDLDGTGFTLKEADINMEGNMASFSFLRYDYTDVDVNGRLKNAFFSGDVSLRDPNAFLDFSGKVDLSVKEPVLEFGADVQNLNLGLLNLVKDNSHYYSMAGNVNITSKGLSLDSFNGLLEVDDMSFCMDDKDYFVERIELSSTRNDDQKHYLLKSSILDAELKGLFTFKGISDAMTDLAAHLLPPTVVPHRGSAAGQNFELVFRVKDFDPITGSVLPKLYFQKNSFGKLLYSDSTTTFSGTMASDSIWAYGQMVKGLVLDMQKDLETVYVTLMATESRVGNTVDLDNFAIDLRAEDDTIYSSMVWDSKEQFHRGDINGILSIADAKRSTFIFGRSEIGIFDNEWQINPNATIYNDTTSFDLRNVQFINGDQSIKLGGMVSEDPNSQLNVEMTRFDLRNANPILAQDSLSIAGSVTGKASVSNAYKKPWFGSDLEVEDLFVNNRLLGDFCVESSYDRAKNRLLLYGELQKKMLRPLKFNGIYSLGNTDSPLSVLVTLNEFDLDILNTFGLSEITDISGKADAMVTLTGTFDRPEFTGAATLQNARFRVSYLNTSYSISDRLIIMPDMIAAENVKMQDRDGNTAVITGQFVHDNYAKWSLNLDADLERMPFLCMNTTQEQNPLYYGKVYATGFVNVFIYDQNSEFTINLKSEKGTSLVLPMEEGEESGFEDFIVFVDPKAEKEVQKETDFLGISLNLELDVTPDAEIKFIFDEALGDILQGRGEGHLSMAINTLGKFNMYGTVGIKEGSYNFTLKNLINKEFALLPGGTISWSGDPMAAELDINTVYKLSASLIDLMSASLNASQYNVRVPVHLIMNLKGQLFNPAIAFKINLPTVDEVTRSYVNGVLSTEEQMNRQAFALLVLLKFVTPIGMEGSGSSTIGNLTGTMANGTEFLTGQLNSWLSQISQDFDLGVNYRPGDEISSSEVALALSTQLFNNRLQLSGNFGMNYGNPSQDNSLIGDVRAEYIIDEMGRLRLLFYNESSQFDPSRLDQRGSTQGLGVVYQIDF